jgi:4-hydroxymandelate oxidase
MTGLARFERRAKELLDPVHYDFFAGGAGDEVALADNEDAFRRLALLPRILRDTTGGSTAVTLLGDTCDMPIFVSPTAFHRLAHSDGERATARATAAAGTILVTGMAATTPVADVTAEARKIRDDPGVWFQLYLQPDPDVTAELVRRAERAGCTALVVTADSPVFGRRGRDDRNGFHDLPPGLYAENMRDLPGGAGRVRPIEMSAAFTWEHLDRLRAGTDLPIVVKGVLHPEDARLALRHGVDAVLVSNHGGRQLDGAPATVDALPAVADAVRGRIPVLLDGGIRSGADAVMALALGATAVGVGRPVLWGLAAGGEEGVGEVLDMLRDELVHTMALCGAASLGDLTGDLVTGRGAGARR